METINGNQRLIRAWETSGMEEEGCCCCGGEAALHGENTLIQLLRHKETRLRRMALFLAVALLTSVVLAILLIVVLGGRGHPSPDNQRMEPLVSHPSGLSINHQLKDDKNPSAMLTAPLGNNTDGGYLKWESNVGNAFCQGGFNYSSGDLVVPKGGIYKVSLQITYEDKKDLKCPSELKLINTVFCLQDSYLKDVPLLSSVDTVHCSMEEWKKSIFTAGSFFLEANCRLRVTSSHPEYIVEKEETLVFFGAYFLHQKSG